VVPTYSVEELVLRTSFQSRVPDELLVTERGGR
jgi:hypothetical protein